MTPDFEISLSAGLMISVAICLARTSSLSFEGLGLISLKVGKSLHKVELTFP